MVLARFECVDLFARGVHDELDSADRSFAKGIANLVCLDVPQASLLGRLKMR